MSDDTLEKHLRWIRNGHECKDPTCHNCEAAHHIRKLFAARPTWDEIREMLIRIQRGFTAEREVALRHRADALIREHRDVKGAC